jgi:hypothetical protein
LGENYSKKKDSLKINKNKIFISLGGEAGVIRIVSRLPLLPFGQHKYIVPAYKIGSRN